MGTSSAGSEKVRVSAVGRGCLVGATVALPGAVMWLMGVRASAVVGLMAVLVLQLLFGAIVWSRLCRGIDCGASEIVGMGLVIGGISFTVVCQLTRSRPTVLVTATLVLSVAALLVIPSMRDSLRRLGVTCVDDGRGLASAVFVGTLAATPVLVRVYREVPLRWTGLHWFHDDVLFSETLIALTAESGATNEPSLLGSELNYHWLGAAWVGGLTRVVGVEPLVATSRIAPVIALVGLSTLAWALAGILGGSRVGQILIVSAVCGGTFVGLRSPWGSQLVVESTTQMITSPWLLGALVLILRIFRGDLSSLPASLLLGGLGFFLVGGKINHAAVLASGLVLAVAVGVLKGPSLRSKSVPSAGAFLLGATAGYLVLFGPLRSGKSSEWLEFGLRRTVAHIWGVIPWPQGSIGAALGGIAVVAAVTPYLFGVLIMKQGQSTAEFQLLSRLLLVGALLSGTFALSALSFDGGAYWFGYSTAAMCCVGGASALSPADVEPRQFRLVSLSSIIGVASAFASYSTAHVGTRVAGSMSWVAPISFLVAVVIGIRALRRPLMRSPNPTLARWWAAPAVAALLVGTVAYSNLINLRFAFRETSSEYMTPTRAVDAELLTAGQWLRRSSSNADALASNRLCSNSERSFPDCTSRWFIPSAFSRVPVLVQGLSYSSSDSSNWETRVRLNAALTNRFDASARDAAWDLGVRWLWLERIAGPVDGWEQIGSLAYENSAVVIVRLREPEK